VPVPVVVVVVPVVVVLPVPGVPGAADTPALGMASTIVAPGGAVSPGLS
jgi:hypothetical protein